MHALLGISPIVLAIAAMVGLKKSAGVSMLLAWGLAFCLAVFFWGLAPLPAAAYTALGFLSSVDVLFIVFAAIFLLNALMELRFIETIGNGFSGISHDRRIQILVVAFFFGAFIEGAAGFGSAAALAAPLLIGLGVPAFFAALSSLLANNASTVFGAAGTPTTVGFATVVPDIYERFGVGPDEYFSALNAQTAFFNMFVATLVPFTMIAVIVLKDGKKRGLRDAFNILPLCLFAGLAFTVPGWLASMLSPALPTLIGALVGLGAMIFAVKMNFLVPKEVYRFRDDPIAPAKAGGTGISQARAWTPYAVIALALVLSRLPWLPFVGWLRHQSVTVSLTGLFGLEGINWAWAPLNNPGILPFLPVAVACLLIAGRKNPAGGGAFLRIGKKTAAQLKNAALALMFGIALVQLMRFTNYSDPEGALGSMSTEIARALSSVFGGAYLAVAPFIGALGSFVAGSTTVSNIMFYGLQLETAALLRLPTVMVLVGQNLGAAIGNAISINNVVAVAATTDTQGRESELIKGAIVPVALLGLLIAGVLFLANWLGAAWIA